MLHTFQLDLLTLLLLCTTIWISSRPFHTWSSVSTTCSLVYRHTLLLYTFKHEQWWCYSLTFIIFCETKMVIDSFYCSLLPMLYFFFWKLDSYRNLFTHFCLPLFKKQVPNLHSQTYSSCWNFENNQIPILTHPSIP